MLESAQVQFATRYYRDNIYRDFLQSLDETVGMHIEYRVCEMPIFNTLSMKTMLETAAVEIALECVADAHLRYSFRSLKPEYTVSGNEGKPLFFIADFAISKDESENYRPKLVELQGFPSLYAYQFALCKQMQRSYPHLCEYDYTFSGLSDEEYWEYLRKAILGNCEPDDVALLEIDPEMQKTRPDFLMLQKMLGIKETNIRSVKKDGKILLHERNGKWRPIRRIFNRTIIDELDDLDVNLSFRWDDELEVEWAGHPNWYFRISKHSLPYLRHPAVPKSRFVSELHDMPEDLSGFVLKPLYSFAGKGVNVNPNLADIAAIPDEEKDKWVLQEKIQYAESVYTPLGLNKAEIRVMCLWLPEWGRPLPVMSLARTGRGPMMGVRFNNVAWTGSSSCLFARE